MSAYTELGSGTVWTPESRTIVHFGSPVGATYADRMDSGAQSGTEETQGE